MANYKVPHYNPITRRLELPDTTANDYWFNKPVLFDQPLTLNSTINGITLSDWQLKIDNITVTAPVDLDGIKTKVDHLSVTQAVDLDQMELDIASLTAAVVLKGTWDASSLVFPTSTKAGESWICTVAGTVGGVPFAVNDRIVALVDAASTSSYADWHKLDYTDEVTSVAGKTGAVTLLEADITDLQSYTLPANFDSLAKLNALCGETIIVSGDSQLTDERSPIYPVAYGITAYATGGQTNATQLDYHVSVITLCATADDSAKLPEAATGKPCVVVNQGAANLALFPSVGDAIGTAGLNNAVTVTPNSSINLVAIDSVTWIQI